jgi:nucleotide-binding universal stress UspA family protein
MAAKPVVVGVDGSEGCLRAVEWAAREAERRNAPLRVVSAPNMPPRMRAEVGGTPTVSTELEEAATRAIEAAVTRSREIAPGLVIDGELVYGAPATALTDEGAGALMLVVGARGIGGFAALLLGSVSRYVAMHAACPVVVVRTESADVQREIVVGVQHPRETTEALTFAFEEAALSGAELVAVHSTHGAGRDNGADATGTIAETLKGWRDKYPAVTVRPDVVHGHPAQVLSEYSARADLVVLGRHGGTGSVAAIGSIQHAVLNHARGSIAIIPEY